MRRCGWTFADIDGPDWTFADVVAQNWRPRMNGGTDLVPKTTENVQNHLLARLL